VLCIFFAGRKDEHAFNGAAIVGLPGVGAPFRSSTLGEDGIESGESCDLIGMKRIGREIYLLRIVNRGMSNENCIGSVAVSSPA